MSEIASGSTWNLMSEGTSLLLSLYDNQQLEPIHEYVYHDEALKRFPPELEGFTSQTGWKIVQQPNGTVRLELGFKGKTYLIGMGPDNSPDILADFV
jgi:hypothetical protein